jgi:NAD(P)-dependent dehydrogenase (short-subunit alcohol dehydrogenase family)
MKLQNKNAIITGATHGLGRVIAEEFLNEGANILICARNGTEVEKTVEELKALHPNSEVYGLQADIGDTMNIWDFYQASQEHFKSVDILVNNAGIQGAKGLFEETDWKEWVNTISVNLMGAVYLTKLLIPQFKRNMSGKIINLSGGGAANPRSYFSAYSVSKAAIVRFTETIAEELQPFNIQCNSIAPGALNTRLLDEVLAAGPENVGPAAYSKFLKQKADGGSSPKLAAELCVFLASSDSDGLTGKLISAVWDDLPYIKNNIEELKKNDVYTLRRILPEDRRK